MNDSKYVSSVPCAENFQRTFAKLYEAQKRKRRATSANFHDRYCCCGFEKFTGEVRSMNNVTRLDSRRDAEAIEWAKELGETEAWLHSERFRHITRLHTAYDAVAEIGKTFGVFLTLRNGAKPIIA